MIPEDFLKNVANSHNLSKSEEDVLLLAMKGKSTTIMAEELTISRDAVRKRLSEIYQKFAINGRGPVKLTKLQQILVNQYQDEETNHRLIKSDDNHLDWRDAPVNQHFYGRYLELETLKTWIIEEKCQIVGILGMAGMGKTTLTVKLVEAIQREYDKIIWLSVNQFSSLSNLLENLCQSLSIQSNHFDQQTNILEEQILRLVNILRAQKCLLILDGFEMILRKGELVGKYQDNYQGTGQLIHIIGTTPHQSCLIINSREKIKQISFLEGLQSPVKSITIKGLGDAAYQILREKGLSGIENWRTLIEAYQGNPLMLKLAANTISEVFDGNVGDFLTMTLLTGEVSIFILETLTRLSSLEREIVQEIAKAETPLSILELQNKLPNNSSQDLISAVTSLKERSLLEKTPAGFILIPIVMKVSRQQFD